MMMLVLTVCSFEGTWNIDRNEKQCESAVFFVKQFEFIMKNEKEIYNVNVFVCYAENLITLYISFLCFMML